MKSLLALIFTLFLVERFSVTSTSPQYHGADIEDNEFAEFEDFDEDDEVTKSTGGSKKEAPSSQSSDQEDGLKESEEQGFKDSDFEEEEEEEDDMVVEDDESEFDHFQDEEEFEGFYGEQQVPVSKEGRDAPKITITKVPIHLRTNWDSFYLELMMIAGLVVYFLNFLMGRARNQKLANAWFATHRTLLEENFSLVGDDGKMENENPGLIKESESQYTLWCSGRVCCEGMLVELKFLKRQDLVAVIAQMIRPSTDQVHIKVRMNKEDMDSFVFCIANKKTATKMVKDITDLSVYAPERRPGEKVGLPAQFNVMSEIGEATTAMLDSRILTIVNRYPNLIDYIHFSDQYSGAKQPEDTTPTKLPEVRKMLMFGFNLPVKGQTMTEAMEQTRPLTQLVFYCVDKVRRFKLSKEAKGKTERNRLRVEEAFLKTTHAVRAEAAAARREEKRRQEKERIMQEDDPDKQRRWEEKEMKRQMKKKAPKMKQLKVKAL